MNETAEAMEETEAAEPAEESKIKPEILSAFEAGINADKEEDMVKIDMIQAGATFKNVTRIYNDLMIDAGLALSKEDKEAVISAACADIDLSTEEGFNSAVEQVNEEVSYTTEKGAATMVRAYARKNEIPYYTKPKGEGGSRSAFINTFCEWVVKNPGATKADVDAFIDTSPNKLSKKFMSRWYAINDMANTIRGV